MNTVQKTSGLKDAWAHAFRVGAAISASILKTPQAVEILNTHFSSITPENAMKPDRIHPEENRWDWAEADKIADFARSARIPVRGHSFVWHRQAPDWFFHEGGGEASKTILFHRLEKHIETITARYNDIVYAWDVLNEAIDVKNGDTENFRQSDWFGIGGKELYEFAFRTARQAAPKARLFYNDYDIEAGKKMEATIRFLERLLAAGAPVHGVGIQAHWNFDYPDECVLRTAIERYSALGLDIELTELDVSAYTRNESGVFFSEMPQDRALLQAERYKEIFRIAADYPAVKNITTWGIADDHTWLADDHIHNRKNWPLLFNLQYQSKRIVPELIDTGFTLTE
jgi:endo-1,4-beta-xylanase